MLSHERFEELFPQCERIVRGLRRRYGFPASEQDDMKQEMALALLQGDDGTDSYCLCRAAWAAVDWLRDSYGSLMGCQVLDPAHIFRLIDEGRCLRVWM